MLVLLGISKLPSSSKVLAAQNHYPKASTAGMNERHSLALAGWSPSPPTTRTTCSPPALETVESRIKTSNANLAKQLTDFCHLIKVSQIKPANIHFCKSVFPVRFFFLLYFCNLASYAHGCGHLSS